MRSVMKHKFSDVPNVQIPRSSFNRSHGYKTTFDAGKLIPILVDEALPGDTFKVSMTGFARLSTPVYPIMDNLFMDTFFFAVPNRLLWSNWEKFCGELTDPADLGTDYTIPVINTSGTGHNNMTLFDYMGIPTKVADSFPVNALPFRAYNQIYNEWFRDQNLQDSLFASVGDGPDGNTNYVVQNRNKRHDYFTSCLPWLQKGDAVQLSLGSVAPITGLGMAGQTASTGPATSYETGGNDESYGFYRQSDSQIFYAKMTAATGAYPEIYADLENATASTVNELRQAIQIQRMLEKDARSGTRYAEILKSHFGVTSADARLQRPEYLGGGSTPVQITPIARTDSSPGILGAMGIAAFKGHGFTKSFTEHCYIIGLVCVRADLTYQEGLDRMWSRESKYDFYWPTLAHLGEQAVLNKEIYLDANDVSDGTADQVFGYQERFAEYRYKNSKITGQFRSNDTASLDAWHLSIEFGDTPTLDSDFIKEDPPIDRVIATPTEPHFIFDSFINMECIRPMPIYSIPGLVDHF